MSHDVKYTINSVRICHDRRRTMGNWYASVNLTQTTKIYSLNKEPKSFNRDIELEIVLNGPGKSKARKKIYRELVTRGFQRDNNSKLEIKIDDRILYLSKQ